MEKVIDRSQYRARQQTPPVFDINASIYVFGGASSSRTPRALSGTVNVACTRCSTPVTSSTSIPKRDYLLIEVRLSPIICMPPTPRSGPFKIISESRLGNCGDTKRKTSRYTALKRYLEYNETAVVFIMLFRDREKPRV